MKILNKWQLWVVLGLVTLSAYGLTKLTQVALVNSTIDSTPIGQTTPAAGKFTSLNASGNISSPTGVVNGFDGLFGTVAATSSGGWSPIPVVTQATNLAWDQSGSLGESDFINQRGSLQGGFSWYSTNGSTVGTQLMSLNGAGLLAPIGGFSGNLTGNVTGNVTGSAAGPSGAFGNLVASCSGCGGSAWTPGGFSQGSWLSLGQNGGINAESDFINRFLPGNVGGFSWFATTGTSLTGQVMNLTPGGVLTVNQVNGNSSSATQLAATPSNCATGYQLANGVAANGNASCATPVYAITGGVSTASSAGSTASATANLTWKFGGSSGTVTMPDTGYAVSCSVINPTGFPSVLGVTKTTTSVTVTIQNGQGNQAGAAGGSEIDCTITGS